MKKNCHFEGLHIEDPTLAGSATSTDSALAKSAFDKAAHAGRPALCQSETRLGREIDRAFFALQFAGGGVSVPAFPPKLRELYE